MRTILCKVCAIVMAIVFVSVGLPDITADAATGNYYSRNYVSYYVAASPTESHTDVCELYVTSAPYNASCKSIDVYGTSGYVRISFLRAD